MEKDIEINYKGKILKMMPCDHSGNEKKEPTEWKLDIKFEDEPIELEIYLNCNYCGSYRRKEISRYAIENFIDHYTMFHFKLVQKSKIWLSYLANEIGIWKNEKIEPYEFEFIGIDLKSFWKSKEDLKYNNFGNHSYEMYFILNGKAEDNYKDVYGLWVVDFQGEMLKGISRRQT